jgi:hypothetical protein
VPRCQLGSCASSLIIGPVGKELVGLTPTLVDVAEHLPDETAATAPTSPPTRAACTWRPWSIWRPGWSSVGKSSPDRCPSWWLIDTISQSELPNPHGHPYSPAHHPAALSGRSGVGVHRLCIGVRLYLIQLAVEAIGGHEVVV